MKKYLFISLSLIILLISVKTVDAQTQQCQPIYGGGQNCVQASEASLNIQVKNPASNEFVDNLGIGDPKYLPGQTVPLKVTLRNNTNNAITNMKATNVFPQFVDYQQGNGKYDQRTRTFTFTVDRLNSKETKVFFINGKVVAKEKLPADQGIVCIINQAAVTFNNNRTSQDNTQFCIAKEATYLSPTPDKSVKGAGPNLNQPNPPTTKGGLPVYPPTQSKTTPPTGPEAFALIGLVPAGAIGFWLRKKTN